ncbi:hypothetical protein SASPL_109465 [Salvia splendens]|uniref:DELLA protein n=1 Tax=Salvia splendens TaxID=180675 RepID=A0A8X8YK35_SALSN|nr:hypothetical protein SASPL_109465 [Salvia splendens]
MAEEANNELPPHDIEANSNVPRGPFALLNRYGNKLKRLSSKGGENSLKSQLLSAVTIMNMAEKVLSQSIHEKRGDVSNLVEAFGSDYADHLKHVLWLLDASEKLTKRQEKIDVERGRIDLEREVEHVDIEKAVMDLKVGVVESERIHFIDFGPKFGSYWILVMDALARQGVKQLKISAVFSATDSVEETGNLLTSFAESMNLPFVFKILHLDTWEFKKDHLQLEAGETVAIFMEFCLMPLSDHPNGIGALLRGIEDLNPLTLIVIDVEADINALNFAPRFKEALFLTCALFDSLEACLGRGNHYRKWRRSTFRRKYFVKFGLVETELSQPSMHQARLMVKGSPSWSYCTLKMNGKSMIIGWNGIPIQFVSAWKFQQ